MIKRHFSVEELDPDEVFFLAEDSADLWKSAALYRLVPWLDGTRTLSDLFEQLSDALSAPEIVFLLSHLQSRGLIADGPGPGDRDTPFEEEALWHALGVEEARMLERLGRAVISMHPAGDHAGANTLTQALFAVGIMVTDAATPALDVAVVDHYYRPTLARLNIDALASGRPWMPCKLVGQTIWIGPVFQPHHTACLECLQVRLRLNHQGEDYLVRQTGSDLFHEISTAGLSATRRIGALLAAQEIALWLAGQTQRLNGRLLSLSLAMGTAELHFHEVVRRPQCPVCGNPALAHRNAPILLRRKPLADAEGYRTQDPRVTLRRLRRHVSPITGVVTRLTDVAKDAEGVVHSIAASHHFAFGLDSPDWLQESIRCRTGGKGINRVHAETSALAEAIERYSGVFRGDEARIRGTYHSLGDKAIHPARCLAFSDRQYDCRDATNSANHEGFFHLVPNRFPEDVEVDWTPLWSLTNNEGRYLPSAYCFYGHPDAARHFFCTGESNGCAAGNTLEEAILQGFLELVERDNVAVWWYNRVSRPGVDLNSFDTPYLRRLQLHYRRHQREFWVLDLTSDLQIPTFAAVSRRLDGPTEDLLIGFGAHLDPTLGIIRSVTEMNQFLPAVWATNATGATNYAWHGEAAVRFWRNETIASQPYLSPNPAARARTFDDFPQCGGPDLIENLQVCLKMAERLELEVLVADQTRPDIDLHVARVVVPGMRHFWRRLAPGRLYDVPVKLGWIDAPVSEESLNPISIFF
jgi:ribosomal protein S12 methylthiotransferase accessory factor